MENIASECKEDEWINGDETIEEEEARRKNEREKYMIRMFVKGEESHMDD